MKFAVILGTRPEIIKMAPVVKELRQRELDFFILHTGQHYSYELDRIFFEQLGLPEPKYNISVGSGSQAEETGKMLIGIEEKLAAEQPETVLVEGDTNSVLAGALTAAKMGIRVGHVEAGLRSYDRAMPEEINRVLTDHISDYLFAPTPQTRNILLGEGIEDGRIFVTGNTVVDAVLQNLEIAKQRHDLARDFHLTPQGYFLVTVHRQENTDDPARLASLMTSLEKAAGKYDLPLLYPIHPRTRKRLKEHGIEPKGLTIIDPVDYLSFLLLESQAKLILTDSGGLQEEACILGVPCVTLRDNTERPETIEAGANMLVGVSPEQVLAGIEEMLARPRQWTNPFGDGHAAEHIVKIITEAHDG